MVDLELIGVEKRFGGVAAVDGVSLAVRPGELLAVLGPSGCGKTTLLRLVAGLERLDGGRILIGGEEVSGPTRTVAPERRNVGMVFQSYALWPHMTVAANAGYPARAAGRPVAEIAARTSAALDAVELGALAGRKPHELSGGQQQRVALARCLVARPAVVLMDEPLANLDQHLRERMLQEFRAFHARSGATILYITHDQAEALSLADRVAVMLDGRVAQVAPPERLYDEPASREVAAFIGQSTLLEGVATGAHAAAAFGLDIALRAAVPFVPGAPALIVIRPEAVRFGEEGAPVRVVSSAYLGGRFLVEAKLASGPALKGYADRRLPAGASLRVTVARSWAVPAPGAAPPGSGHGGVPAQERLAMA